MSFASPIFFWTLLSLIPLMAIYLLKVRPVRKPTTAFFLWDNIFQEKKATSLFQRFRDLFSLLMMALAFCAIAFALTRPDFSGDDQKDLVLLIDNSASMSAEDGFSTRLENAKSVASQIVRALNGTQRCSVASVSNETNYLSNLTDNPRELLDAIASVSASSLPSSIDALNQFRKKAVDNEEAADGGNDADDINAEETENYRFILISDGMVGGDVPGNIELLKIGGATDGNVGIVACDMQRLPGGQNRVGVFCQIASTFKQPIDAELTLSHETIENVVKLIPLEIQPGINSAEVFEMEDTPIGKWFVQLEVAEAGDSLPDDNLAYLVLPPKRPIPVAVVADDRFFFENCVLAFSRSDGLLQLVENTAESKSQLNVGVGGSKFDEDLDSDLLIFYPDGDSPWWNQLGEEIEVTLPQMLDENHPVVRHFDATAIPFVGARRLIAPPGSEVFVAAEDGTPLIYRTSKSGRSAIVVNLDPLASEFYLSAWFPVLVYSSATHLAGRTEIAQSTYPTGRFAFISGVQVGETTTIEQPNGVSQETTENLFGPLRSPGFYSLNNSGGDWKVSSSLLSQDETLLDNSTVEDSTQPVNRGFSPAAWLTLLAILVVTAESVLYQRRRVG